jgi:hypothetical protein
VFDHHPFAEYKTSLLLITMLLQAKTAYDYAS